VDREPTRGRTKTMRLGGAQPWARAMSGLATTFSSAREQQQLSVALSLRGGERVDRKPRGRTKMISPVAHDKEMFFTRGDKKKDGED
jgi:hypothetical protein